MAVCPEPVLVKRSFLYINGMAKDIYIYIYMRFPHHRRHGAVQPHDPQRSDLIRVQTTQPHNNAKQNFSSNYPNVCPEPVLANESSSLLWIQRKRSTRRASLWRYKPSKRRFETRRGSNFRPFSFGSSRFNVQMSA
eukprot:COSAG06_NODE_34898_length_467_cov_5.369565_1_plen_135_part_10